MRLDVVSAAQSLISALTQTLNLSPVTPRSQVQVQGQGQQTAVQEQRQTNTTIDQEMARCMLLAIQSMETLNNIFKALIFRHSVMYIVKPLYY